MEISARMSDKNHMHAAYITFAGSSSTCQQRFHSYLRVELRLKVKTESMAITKDLLIVVSLLVLSESMFDCSRLYLLRRIPDRSRFCV